MPKTFDSIVKDQFGFLVSDFQYRLEWCKQIDGGFDVLYGSKSCGVHIVYEFREAYLFITLHELQDGKFIDNPRPVKPESVLTGFSLDDILLQRAPEAVIKPAYSYGEESKFYDKKNGLTLYVSQFAEALKKHASDVLTGNFKIFKALEPIVKKRAGL
jgi:hypothetical protein